MGIPNEELEYLSFAKEKIEKELTALNAGQDAIQNELFEKRKYLWTEIMGTRSASDRYEEAAQKSEIVEEEKKLKSAAMQLEALRKLRKTPYFARVDFKEDGFPAEKVYIGHSGLTDMERYEQIICDWRSDIASIYYNYEPGPASYSCDMGDIDGEMTLKRQFQIENGEMLGCFDTELSIEDHFLQKILSAHAGESMKTIVDSIQGKQNEIIRETDSAIVMINGCAGSGKTSIALHRIAYLLYRSRKTLKATDCIIFSPNTLFEDYISSVLPDLGEESVWQTTFADFANEIFGAEYEVSSYIETLADGKGNAIAQKSDEEFSGKLRNAAKCFEETVDFCDLFVEGMLIISKDEQKELFNKFRKSMNYTQSCNRLLKYSMDKIFRERKEIRRKIAERLVEEKGMRYFMSERELKTNARLEEIYQVKRWHEIFTAQHVPNVYDLYAEILTSEFGEDARKQYEADLAEKKISFEDSTALLYLMKLFGQISSHEKMRQVIIDEAQDYTDLQYLLLLEIYPYAHFTVLGDNAQSLSGHGRFWESISKSTNRGCKQFELDVNYRSSKEIVDFTNKIVGKELCRAIERSAGEVLCKEIAQNELSRELNAYLDEGSDGELAAVVCATNEEAREIFKALGREDCCLIEHEFASRNRRICILPVYLAKGLEFDRVAVVNTNGELSGNGLYVACTRALHKLAVFDVR